MSSHVRLTGFAELVKALDAAPAEIRAEGMQIVREETEGCASETIQAYPQGATGNLRARVKTSYPASDLLVGIVQSTAPHSHIYEFGTQQRRNSNGANRGSMPAANVMVPIAQRRRERMMVRLRDMLERMGLVVNG